MDVTSKYWRIIRIDAAGNRKIQEVPSAKTFCTQIFGDINTYNVSDDNIQKQLLYLYKGTSAEDSTLAERCLLCFISWSIERACRQLEIKFGENHGFNCNDLLRYVLDDDGRLSPRNSYQSFSREILVSFETKQGSLTNWINIKVKQHPDLNQFLLECGVYIISNWAILNDTNSKQLEKIFQEFYSFTHTEIQQAKYLLESYHAVYRVQRLQQRSKGIRSKCAPPTTQQLQAIAKRFSERDSSSLSSILTHSILAQLQKLASLLREYRIHVRGRSLPTVSLDATTDEANSLAERIPSPASNNLLDNKDEQAFLQLYRQQFQICLQESLARVTELKVKQLQSKKK